jgi:hypothetical protein
MLGGIVGTAVGIIVLYSTYFGSFGYAVYMGFFAIIFILPITIIIGTVVGSTVWVITRLLRTNKLAGAAIGVIIALILGAAIGAIFDANHTQTGNKWFFVKFGAIAGAVVGLISGADDHTKRSS